MNDELQKALAAILSKTTNALEAGVNFLQAELPDVIRQLLVWHATKSAIHFVLTTLVCAALVTVSVKFFKAAKGYKPKNIYDDPVFQWMACAASGVFAFFALMTAMNMLDWLQILVAPKLYLIEYAASLAKK